MSDNLRDLCIKQGYVSEKCTLPGPLIWSLINAGKNPCKECNVENCDRRK